MTNKSPPTDRIGIISKRYRYVTLTLESRDGKAEPLAITLHEVEAKRLAESLQAAAAAPSDQSFRDTLLDEVEGIYLGGPPERDELVEFMDPKPWERDR